MNDQQPSTTASDAPEDSSLDAPQSATALTPESSPAVAPGKRLEAWQRKLLDLTRRNRLLNFKATARTLILLGEDLEGIENALAMGRDMLLTSREQALADDVLETMREAGLGDSLDGDTWARNQAFSSHCTEDLATALEKRRLVVDLTQTECEDRQVKLFRESRTIIEETGSNTLFLALGFLRWYEEDASDKPAHAPVLLLPVTLVRKSAREGYVLRAADDDARLNVTLVEMLRQNFGLVGDDLEELLEGDGDNPGLDVTAMLDRMAAAVSHLPRWQVVPMAAVGFFSFAKFVMWRDLREHATALMAHPLIQHLNLTPGNAFDPNPMPKESQVEDLHPPQEVFCPLDADSSQLAAVFAASSGRSFVLQGPPGTGKSQTITNLIAQCMAMGKRVLFVAEKLAALTVVNDRLEKVGLGPFCLELHSSKVSKKQVLEQLRRAQELTGERSPQGWGRLGDELSESRRRLNAYVDALHSMRSIGMSVFAATGRCIHMRAEGAGEREQTSPMQLGISATTEATHFQKCLNAARELGDAYEAVPEGDRAGLRPIGVTSWETSLEKRITESLSSLESTRATLEAASLALAPLLGVPLDTLAKATEATWRAALNFAERVSAMPVISGEIATWGDWRANVESAKSLFTELTEAQSKRAAVLELAHESLLSLDVEPPLHDARDAWTRAGQAGWLTAWLHRRRGRKLLQPYVKGTLGDNRAPELIDLALDARARARRLKESNEGQRLFGNAWQGVASNLNVLQAQAVALKELRQAAIAFAEALKQQGISEVQDSGLYANALELSSGRRADSPAPEVWQANIRTARDAFVRFESSLSQASHVLQTPADIALYDSGTPWLPTWRDVISHCSRALSSLREWCRYQLRRSEAIALKLADLVAALELHDMPPSDARAEAEYAMLDAWLRATIDRDSQLREFTSAEHQKRIEHFRRIDREMMDLTQAELRSRLAARAPSLDVNANSQSELGILKRELAKKGRHLPVRQLMKQIPNLVARLKPCFLMSPMSIAQYLDSSLPPFDLVVFDEASQIFVHDAIGAISRGRSCVVVGDSRQLPPTNFFQRMDTDDDQPDLEGDTYIVKDLESILDECDAAGLHSMHLRWHYRSRHEELIAFSNHHYYDNRLYTFPNAIQEHSRLGVHFHHVSDGVYDRAKSRTNRIEAERLVEFLVQELRNELPNSHPRTYGVVTLSQAQQVLIQDLLDARLREEPQLERFFGTDDPESVFIKNLENVQGDERDVMLFSVGYGPDAAGKLAFNFGPINTTGGERRLNVAVTRARQAMHVFSSIRAEQIDLNRTNALGAQHLKSFLAYAEMGPQSLFNESMATGELAESPFETQVASALRERGWQIDHQVGCSGYRIDLAVKHPEFPGAYLIGIECDGASYHSASSARDRDRLRQAVLERLGWKLVRVWSTDWWLDPARELDKVEASIKAALDDYGSGDGADNTEPPSSVALDPGHADKNAPSVSDAGPADSSLNDASEEDGSPESSRLNLPGARLYASTRLPGIGLDSNAYFERSATRQLQAQIAEIVATEAPLDWDMLCQRIRDAWGIQRFTKRAEDRLEDVLRAMPADTRPVYRGEFLWAPGQDPLTFEGFRVPPDRDSRRSYASLPPEEIANAAHAILEQQFSLPFEELVKEVARVFNYSSTGAKLRERIEEGISLLARRGDCIIRDGLVLRTTEGQSTAG